MADLGFVFKPSEQEERRGEFPVIPAGKYVMHAIEGDTMDHNNGMGVWFQMEVLEGENAGSQFRVFMNNIVHTTSAIAQKIAREALGEYGRAVGVVDATKTDDFLFKKFVGYVKVIPAGFVRKSKNGADYTYPSAQNEMGSYEPYTGQKLPPVAAASPVTQLVQRPAAPAASVADPVPAAIASKLGSATPAWRTPRAVA